MAKQEVPTRAVATLLVGIAGKGTAVPVLVAVSGVVLGDLVDVGQHFTALRRSVRVGTQGGGRSWPG